MLTILTGVTITLYGRQSEVQVLLISMMIFVFVLFDSWSDWIMIGGTVLLAWFVPYLSLELYGPLDETHDVPYLHFVVMAFAFFSISILAFVVMENLKLYLHQKDEALATASSQNQELVEKNKHIQQQKDELEIFTSVAAHDLKTPIRTISSFLGLLERTQNPDDRKSKEYINHIKSGAEQLHSLVNGIRDYRQIEDNPTYLSYSTTVDILDQIRADLKNQYTDRVILNYEVPNNLKIDKSHLTQIFDHLIDNAIRYNNKQVKEIKITSILSTDNVLIRVKDNGIGIDPEYLSYIFEPFKKLHSSHIYEGSGLGLSIAKKIINKYGGTIEAQSSPSGSTFIITFPRAIVV